MITKQMKILFTIFWQSLIFYPQNIFSKWEDTKEMHVMNKDSGDKSPIAVKNISITIVYDNNPYFE